MYLNDTMNDPTPSPSVDGQNLNAEASRHHFNKQSSVSSRTASAMAVTKGTGWNGAFNQTDKKGHRELVLRLYTSPRERERGRGPLGVRTSAAVLRHRRGGGVEKTRGKNLKLSREGKKCIRVYGVDMREVFKER